MSTVAAANDLEKYVIRRVNELTSRVPWSPSPCAFFLFRTPRDRGRETARPGRHRALERSIIIYFRNARKRRGEATEAVKRRVALYREDRDCAYRTEPIFTEPISSTEIARSLVREIKVKKKTKNERRRERQEERDRPSRCDSVRMRKIMCEENERVTSDFVIFLISCSCHIQ